MSTATTRPVEDITFRQFQEDNKQGVEIVHAPAHSAISLESLRSPCGYLRVHGVYITFCGQVTYRVAGWDHIGGVLLISRVDQ